MAKNCSFLVGISTVPLSTVCQFLSAKDIIMLSLISTKHCDLVAKCSKKMKTIDSFQWDVDGNKCHITLNFGTTAQPQFLQIKLAEATWNEMTIIKNSFEHYQFAGENVMCRISDKLIEVLYPRSRRIKETYWMNKFSDHLIKLFTVKNFRLYYNKQEEYNIMDCFVFKHTKHFAKFIWDCEPELFASDNEMDFVLDQLNVEMFVMKIPTTRDYAYHGILKFKHIDLEHWCNAWVSFKNLKTMLCTSMCVSNSHYTANQCNELVKDWLAGKKENLQILKLSYSRERHWTEAIDVLKGLKCRKITGVTTFFRNEFVFITYNDVFSTNKGLEKIERSDGRTAYLMNEAHGFNLGVCPV